jgi:hypothetical protein
MKKIILILTLMIFILTSCSKYLDINTNPNSAISAIPSTVLPLAIVNTASFVSNLNNYGSQTVGYAANAGGYGGYGSSWTYNYLPSDGEGYWDLGYTTLENFENIVNSTQGSDVNAYYNATSKIMEAFIFQNLVDEFNDIPYTQSLKGAGQFQPVYDKATAIYPSLALLLDSAVAEINSADQFTTPIPTGSDPLFGGNMVSWKRFANTLKLRLIVRASSVVTFANKTFTADGFLTDDAIVNPGYTLANSTSGSQVSPSWNAWVTNYAGSRQGNAWIPASYVYGYYDGHKLVDPARGLAIYYNFPSTPYNQLGIMPPSNTLTSPATAGAWYSGGGSGTSLGSAIGVLKGPNMGEPLLLLAESDFLQAEAALRGIISGSDATLFNNGVTASFRYLYKTPNNSVATGMNPAADAATYFSANSTNYLTNYSLAVTTAQKTEAIITQKYIALNFIHGQEAWSEYRRTGYPVSSSTLINNPFGAIASTQSQATRADHLPTRLPYPASEANYNAANVPQNISVYTTTIFWAH